MKISSVLVSVLAGISSAHNAGPGMPKLMGARQFLARLKATDTLSLGTQRAPIGERKPSPVVVEERANIDGQCGAGFGSCATGYCCSPEGWCGTTSDYCSSPDCQLAYGTGCDGNQMPAGTSTASIARPLLGSIPYGGAGIYDCVTPGDVAFTFDDGPYSYTADLLDKLKAYNAKASFMITGNNLGKGPIDTTPAWSNVIKRMIAEGHQVASHTWSHQNLSSLSATVFNNQMIYNEMAFRNILGFFPTYMRPPYSECSSTCQSRLKTLGYHITYFDLDTQGYLMDSSTLIQNSKNIWTSALKAAKPTTDSILEIEHDIHYQTVYNLTDFILSSMYAKGFKSVTVGQCLGDPEANWYRAAGSALPSSTTTPSTTPTTPPKTISTDGSCSATITCLGSTFGNCCSQHNYCGSSSDYCGTGCQADKGSCTGTGTGTGSSTSSYSSKSQSQPLSSSTSMSTKTSVSSSVTKTSTSTPPPPSATLKKSPDGTCGVNAGAATGNTCAGSTFGVCCSQYGWCGGSVGSLTSTYCGVGCQGGFGICS